MLSRTSNHREGVLRELRVANAVQKKAGDLSDFIIPIRIDDLPHGEINIEIGRLNVVEFGANWASGLKQLCRKFEADKVPRSLSGGPDVVRRWWEREFAVDSGVDDVSEPHYSNWFPVQLPDRIYRYSPIGLVDPEPRLPFPIRWHEGRLVTFASGSEVEQNLEPLRIQDVETFDTTSFMSEENQRRRDNRNIVVGILTDAWEQFASSRELKSFEMANGRAAFYFDLDVLPGSIVFFTSVDGARKRRSLMGYKTRKSGMLRHWHFALTAKPAVHPQPVLQVRTHVLFSDDGRTIWSSPDARHRARRSQCRQWWNDDWRDRILASMSWLAINGSSLTLPLSVSSAVAVVGLRPVEFLSPVSLREPSADLDVGTATDEIDDEDEPDDLQ